ncbi:MAG: hypothetical protein JNG88_04715 [Phycisphaerales bacterium]|nr:hypothetical protein [Phycisphaerales bacterium]
MAVVPINLARVSTNLRAFNLLNTVRSQNVGMFSVQNQLATGLKYNSPSQSPTEAMMAGVFERRIETLGAAQRNLRTANAVITSGEAAMSDAISLLTQANTLATESASDTLSAEERGALAISVDSILNQMISVGNRKHLDTYLFAGFYSDQQPFELVGDGVIYRGDDNQHRAIVEADLTAEHFTLNGADFFSAVSDSVVGVIDLNPGLTSSTRVSDLRGTTGNGVQLGRVRVSDGTTTAIIDLSGAATVGDIVEKLNAELPATLEAAMDEKSILIQPGAGSAGATVSVEEDGSGTTARDLGLLSVSGGVAGATSDLDPRLTARSTLDSLNDGAGISLASDIVIRNGARNIPVDFAGAETIEDVLNRINSSDAAAWARLSDDGRRIEVRSRLSGANLYIEEAGGNSATLLGIRSLRGDTQFSEMNHGRGVHTVAGDDFRIVTASGAAIDIDVDGVSTMQELIDRINAAGGGAVTASLTPNGNGLRLIDQTSGSDTFRVEKLNLSPAIDDLGIAVASNSGVITGADHNPIRVNSPFTALMELRDALRSDDQQSITFAGQRVSDVMSRMLEAQGRMAAQARNLGDRELRLESETTATRVMHSDVRDVDISEAIVKFQQLQTALEANLQTASRIMNLSLMNYLQ